jgi:hypothetical protein
LARDSGFCVFGEPCRSKPPRGLLPVMDNVAIVLVDGYPAPVCGRFGVAPNMDPPLVPLDAMNMGVDGPALSFVDFRDRNAFSVPARYSREARARIGFDDVRRIWDVEAEKKHDDKCPENEQGLETPRNHPFFARAKLRQRDFGHAPVGSPSHHGRTTSGVFAHAVILSNGDSSASALRLRMQQFSRTFADFRLDFP